MNKEHTQGRLRVPDDGTVGSIETEDGTPIGHTFQVSSHDQGFGSPIRRANARRLVACWNACSGLDTHFIEHVDQQRITNRLVDYSELVAQRDQLLKALENLVSVFSLDSEEAEVVAARAAFTACKPQPTVQHLPSDDTEGGAL